MRRNAFGAKGASVVSSSLTSARAEEPKASIRPPPTAAVIVNLRKLRRETGAAWSASVLISRLRARGRVAQIGGRRADRQLDRGADTWIGPAPTDVARHRRVDVR